MFEENVMTSMDGEGQLTFAGLRRLLAQLSKRIATQVEDYLSGIEQAMGAAIEKARQEGYKHGLEEAGARAEREIALIKHNAEDRVKAAEDLAHRDGFTGLYNKEYFLGEGGILPNYVYNEARDRRDRDSEERRSELAALWVVDLDKLKLVNDSIGHLSGDEMIKLIATLLKQHIRQDTSVSGRIRDIEAAEYNVGSGDTSKTGGDEFAVLQTRLSLYTDAYLVADRVKQLYRTHPWRDLDERLEILGPDVSIGVIVLKLSSIWGHQDKALDIARLWYLAADEAMYEAKRDQLDHIVIKGLEYDGEKLRPFTLEGGISQRMMLER
jgi:two-component system, sensor histidine kinase LadS